MKQNLLKIVFAVFALVGIGFAMNTNTANATSGDFTLKPEASSSSKVNIDGGFYYIDGDPGETVDLKVGVYNTSKESRQFIVYGNTAFTTDEGQPGYDKLKVKDPNLKISMHDLFQNNKQIVTVPAGKDVVVTMNLTIPTQTIGGFLMGGINIQPYHESAKGTVAQDGTLIKNKFSYSLPIELTQAGTKRDDVNYKINLVKPRIVNTMDGKEIGVAANVANTSNAFVSGLSSKATITKYGDKGFKKTETKDDQSIVPTSNYNYTVGWGKEPLKAGKYHIKMVYSGNGVRTWVLDKDFTITNAQANQFNKLAGHKPNYLWLYILLAVLVLALIMGLGVYLGKKGNKGKSAPSRSNNSRNRRRRRR
ncbi:DUF3324 domain-containing protein [Companilactobacillus mishanensis]|uniref:DUF3324 domain-containing protein n=1 Tax=Companilactobacillus mishanensis TaxID=2486008 RepID=UPI00129798E4|nr:DUF3324 domain-containing protein [Companilactobacillus mishanensis]MQS89149.1 DUF3324 domain-containing protein [Companilactobacillus mishanensis]